MRENLNTIMVAVNKLTLLTANLAELCEVTWSRFAMENKSG